MNKSHSVGVCPHCGLEFSTDIYLEVWLNIDLASPYISPANRVHFHIAHIPEYALPDDVVLDKAEVELLSQDTSAFIYRFKSTAKPEKEILKAKKELLWLASSTFAQHIAAAQSAGEGD